MVKKGYLIYILFAILFLPSNTTAQERLSVIPKNLKLSNLSTLDNFKLIILEYNFFIDNRSNAMEHLTLPYMLNTTLNIGISKLQSDSKILQIKEKQNRYEIHGAKYQQITKNIWLISIIAVILMVFGFTWVWLLRLHIKNKTDSIHLKNLQLQKNEEKFRIITENSTDILWQLDSNFIVTYISPADERIRGFKNEESLGSSLFSVLKPEGIETVKAANKGRIDKLANGIVSPPAIYELEKLCKDGSWVWIEATATAQYDEEGKVSGYHGVSRDISERKKAEKLLKENDKQLRELVSTKEKLFSIIAHDLRSPFTTILGISEILIENSKDFDTEQSEKYLGIINTSAKNTLVLLDNLLNWAKAQTGIITYYPQKINLTEVVNEILDVAKSIAKVKTISVNYIPADDVEVYADANMLKTILRNLISNAIKYTHENGKINISAVKNQNNIEITVADNGVGMSEEIRSKLFEIENIVSTAGTANETGSGLGLILCKEFVEKHSGKIWIEGELGKGSSCTFSLPLSCYVPIEHLPKSTHSSSLAPM